jgi:hypothetical protein
MTNYWCVNFDGNEDVLHYGFREKLWAMQYQYSHGGHVYQGDRSQLHLTTSNWREAAKVKPSDWLLAYLRPSRFFAAGQVIEPTERDRHHHAPRHTDSIKRTTREHAHRFLRRGVVRYKPETTAFYEDFTDAWFVPHGSEKWKYAQRIDVKEWEDKQSEFIGVRVFGLAEAARSCGSFIRLSVFRISEPFFEEVREQLKR